MELENTQLKKGIIESLILFCLNKSDMYGYEIIQLLDEESDGIFRMKEGTLYPILYRLEDAKCIESYWINANEKRGIPRKYYKITDTGKNVLQVSIGEWKLFSGTIDKIFEI